MGHEKKHVLIHVTYLLLFFIQYGKLTIRAIYTSKNTYYSILAEKS